MFWGLILKANKKYTQKLEKPFHLSQASLDGNSSDNEPIQVMYQQEDNNYLLCTLQKGKIFQCSLDLNFQEGDVISFSTKGNGIVHLTGFLIPEEDDFGDVDMDEELSDEEMDADEIGDLRQKLSKKQQNQGKLAAVNKKLQPAKKESEDEDDSDEDDDLEESAMQDSEDDDEEAEEEEDEDEDDDDDEDEEEISEEEEEQAPPPKQQKLDKNAKQQNGNKQKLQENGLSVGKEKKKIKTSEPGAIRGLQGGLTIQDLKVGTGAEAKPSRKIQVYYEGRLKSNNKVFDSTKAGPGFKFSLGRSEVIKGWDIGLVGMKVGGKRRIVCPPNFAYGAKGNPPVIPQNATLIFDVELKNVI